MADETPPARGFSSGSQGSSEGAPRLRGADVSVPCCWSLRNSSKWPGPTSSGPFLSLKSVCAEDRSRRQHHTAQAPAGAPGLCRPRRRVTPAPAPAGLAGRPGQAVPVASLNLRSSSPQRPLPLWAPPFLTGAWAPPRAPPVQAELEQLLPKATTPGPPADPGLEGLGSSPTFHPAPAVQSHFRQAAWPARLPGGCPPSVLTSPFPKDKTHLPKPMHLDLPAWLPRLQRPWLLWSHPQDARPPSRPGPPRARPAGRPRDVEAEEEEAHRRGRWRPRVARGPGLWW